MIKKIAIVGLRLSNVPENPITGLQGTPNRTWALFAGLPQYGFETHMYVEANARVHDTIAEDYGYRFIRTPESFLTRVEQGEFDTVIIVGTKLQTSVQQQPWLLKLKNTKIYLAQCYHNDPKGIPEELVDQMIGCSMETPLYKRLWEEQFPGCPTSIRATVTPSHPPTATEADGSAVFVGHIHNLQTLVRLFEIARLDSEREYHIVSSMIREVGAGPGVYRHMDAKLSMEQKRDVFRSMMNEHGCGQPDNVVYHHLPQGSESDLLGKVSVGIDVCWNRQWVIDNSKVTNYLTYGLNVVAEKPSQSSRFVTRFKAGTVLPFKAPPEDWRDAIQDLSQLEIEQKNARRRTAGEFFSWENAVFDLAAHLLDLNQKQEGI